MTTRSRTQIIATIGPTSGDAPDVLDRMLAAGLDVARVNFSHGTHESNGSYIRNLREAAARAGMAVPVMMDLAGPRMKTAEGHGFDASLGESLTPKDLDDVSFAIELELDYVALSYVGSAEDVRLLRSEIGQRGGSQKIVAKIERQAAIDDYDAIMEAADAVMVARGDLGDALPFEDLPFVQRELITRAKRAGKPVITATQMMYSMIENPQPTRAEVTDVAFAVMLGSDAVMLSDETARGKHPIEAVAAMERIVSRAERDQAMLYAVNVL